MLKGEFDMEFRRWRPGFKHQMNVRCAGNRNVPALTGRQSLLWVGMIFMVLTWTGGCQSTSHQQAAGKQKASPAAKTPTAQTAVAKDWCAGHEVPESKCTICNPELIPQFKAAGDWCAGHNLPESVCPMCNHGGSVPASADPNDWCGGHNVPESKCTICNPELIPQFQEAGDWCAGHNLPESVCPMCNPNVPVPAGAPANDWCAGHNVPESKCTLCNPELIPHFQEVGDWCVEHELPESVCPICNPDILNQVPLEQRVVRFNSPEKEAQVGLRTVTVRRGSHKTAVEAPASVAFNADTVADLRSVVDGVVEEIFVSLGDKVEKGQALFQLVSTEVGEAQAALRAARAKVRVAKINLERHESLVAKKIAPRWELEQAELDLETAQADVAAAVTTLKTAGASENGPAGKLVITAPMAGTLVKRPAVKGMLATEGTSLGMIADTEHMWVMSEIPERQAASVRKEQLLHFRSDDGQEVVGEIAWMAAEVDSKTRTVSVRAKVCNHEGSLRARQFGRAKIETDRSDTWLVPANAIQRIDQRRVVFVKHEPGAYVPREVQVLGSGDWTPVAAQFAATDEIVTTGAVLLRTEMLPGSIGAGCCEVEPLGASSEER